MKEADIWTLEEGFWRGDAAFFEGHLASGAWMIFPDPAGVLDRRQAMDTLKAAPRWESVEMAERRLAFPAERVAVLSYTVNAGRPSAPDRYFARCGSTYVETADGWKLFSHQQTPAGAG